MSEDLSPLLILPALGDARAIEVRATVTGFALTVPTKDLKPATVALHEDTAARLAEWLTAWNDAGFDDA